LSCLELNGRYAILVTAGKKIEVHCSRRQKVIKTESHCLLKQLKIIIDKSDPEAGMNIENSARVLLCGDAVSDGILSHCSVVSIS